MYLGFSVISCCNEAIFITQPAFVHSNELLLGHGGKFSDSHYVNQYVAVFYAIYPKNTPAKKKKKKNS